MSTNIKERIHLLHHRPLTPLFMLKSKHGEIFDVKEGSMFLAPRLKEIFQRVRKDQKRMEALIPLKECSVPDIKFATDLPIDGDFSTFLVKHQTIASKLTRMFLDTGDLNQLMSLIAYVRDRINPRLFYYSLGVALAHKPETSTLTGDIFNAFPTNFMTTAVIDEAHKKSFLGVKMSAKNPISPPVSGTFKDSEYRVAYFREDLALNSHHWHWHIVYPFGPDLELVNKDRRGELFFYMHQQMMGRYNTERLNTLLPRAIPFYDFRSKVSEGYYSKLRLPNSSKDWSGRPANITWHDLNRPADKFVLTINDMDSWRMRIEQAIDAGSVAIDQKDVMVSKDGTRIIHHKDLTIDMLGNMVESSILSPNQELYGNLHNNGHIFTSYMHDPDRKYLEPMAVMGDTSTAIRDPFFFKWHGFIDELFQRFKSSAMCPQYTPKDLMFQDMIVQNIELNEDADFYKNVLTEEQRQAINKDYKDGMSTEELHTFWMNSVVKTDGLDFEVDTPIFVNYKHLDHIPFSYKILVNNTKDVRKGTVRVFLAPKYDESRVEFKLNEQRRLFLEMDRFVYEFNKGVNTIVRKSTQSSITIPLEQQFPESLVTPNPVKDYDMYCKCGWPQHLLVPKGMPKGSDFRLFVMVSDYELDKVVVTDTLKCKESSSFCGLKDNKYPDARSMGYPFDRAVDNDIYLAEFIEGLSNMKVKEISIKFTEVDVVDPRTKAN